MNVMTCIYPIDGRRECGQTPDTLVGLYPELGQKRRHYGDLVLLQEHLRDDHTGWDTPTLQRQLEQTRRIVTYQGQTREVKDWDNRIQYDRIEWRLPDGTLWLRLEKNDAL